MSQATVVYEITAIVRNDFVERYEKYMRERHVPELLETGYFRGAKFTRSLAAAMESDEKIRYRIQYEARDEKSLDDYLAKDAPRLRADFLANFPVGVELKRENWRVLQVWESD